MGQVTVDNDADRDYWKGLLTHLTGEPPTVEGVRDYRITLTSESIDQETLAALISIWQRNKGRARPVEVALPSLAEREEAARMQLERNRAVADERMGKDGTAPLSER